MRLDYLPNEASAPDMPQIITAPSLEFLVTLNHGNNGSVQAQLIRRGLEIRFR